MSLLTEVFDVVWSLAEVMELGDEPVTAGIERAG
jgi:hypothetical protein